MLTVAYLANQFPCAVEPYVGDEIAELRRRGVRVIAGTVRKTGGEPDIVLQTAGWAILLRGLWLCLRERKQLSDLIARLLFRGHETPWMRIKALLHTWLGACYALMLRKQMRHEEEIAHIHVHHGYFGSWIAMVAARLLRVSFSMMLHGSDLLRHGVYLDVKLENCKFCLTVSEFNRRHALERYPNIHPHKMMVSRLGAEVADHLPAGRIRRGETLALLAVGRLHAVKDHAFLVRACARLRDGNVPFECSIAGEGPERPRLGSLIRRLHLSSHVFLLGHVPREQMNSLYDRADVVALTSRSEGIPLVLMEAMARGKIVLAPAITGIPELVIPDKTGFLYEAGSLDDFTAKLLSIRSALRIPQRLPSDVPLVFRHLDWIGHAARVHVRRNFNRTTNLESFGDIFMQRIAPRTESIHHEDLVLQQIQLPVQRHRGVPVRTHGTDAVERTRSGIVLHV